MFTIAIMFCLIIDDSGEVDWDTLGKILSAHILGEVSYNT